ncbi:hypothetical protein AS026_37495 [Rhizobium altiplani]|uniref:DNA-binding protein n=1 Tax=Rhizobium altiplani TaxID=1864509 RepID=A0A109JV81_9HYPH|nr:hypothetical protein [Rhizobium altiplani]KWV55734.1 hypothetical protein AS026_37495 [Rhizobium altiplani]
MPSDNFSQLIAERYQFWTDQGKSGAQLFDAMGADPVLPFMLGPEDAAVVVGSTPSGLKQQRARRTGPPYIRLSGKLIGYPRPDLFRHLAQRYVGRAA